MDFQQLIDSITPDIYKRLKQAVETGRWPNGEMLTPEQRQHSLQAVIAYDQKHKPAHERVGYIPAKPHTHCGGEAEVEEPQPIKWRL